MSNKKDKKTQKLIFYLVWAIIQFSLEISAKWCMSKEKEKKYKNNKTRLNLFCVSSEWFIKKRQHQKTKKGKDYI